MRRARRDLTAICHAATIIIKNLKSPGAATGADIVMPLPTSIHDACLCGKAKETLISLSVVDYSDTLDIHGQDESPLGVIQMLHDFRRIITKRRHRLNVFGDIHDAAQLKLPNKVMLGFAIRRHLARIFLVTIRRKTGKDNHQKSQIAPQRLSGHDSVSKVSVTAAATDLNLCR